MKLGYLSTLSQLHTQPPNHHQGQVAPPQHWCSVVHLPQRVPVPQHRVDNGMVPQAVKTLLGQ